MIVWLNLAVDFAVHRTPQALQETMDETLEEQKIPATKATEETPFEALASICGVLVVGLFVLTFIFQNFEIPSSSMEKTLLIGDHVLVDRIALAPPSNWMPLVHYRNVQRGDIIVFFKPGEPDLYLVKRVVGIPGDRIHLRNGIVFLNGEEQNEPQAGKPTDSDYYPYRDDFPAISPPEGSDVTASWSVGLPANIQGEDLVVPRENTSPWATIAPSGSTAAIGDSCREKTLSVGPSSYTGRSRPLRIRSTNKAPRERISFIGHMILHFFDETRWNRTLHVVR